MKLDGFDRKMIDILAVEGRISVTALADRIGLSKSPTQTRLKRLEEAGVIRGYRASFDAIRLGRAHVSFVEVKLEDTREAALASFNATELKQPEIEECHLMLIERKSTLHTGDVITEKTRSLAEQL